PVIFASAVQAGCACPGAGGGADRGTRRHGGSTNLDLCSRLARRRQLSSFGPAAPPRNSAPLGPQAFKGKRYSILRSVEGPSCKKMVTPAAKREAVASCTFRVRVERAAGVQDHRLCAHDGAVLFAPAAPTGTAAIVMVLIYPSRQRRCPVT